MDYALFVEKYEALASTFGRKLTPVALRDAYQLLSQALTEKEFLALYWQFLASAEFFPTPNRWLEQSGKGADNEAYRLWEKAIAISANLARGERFSFKVANSELGAAVDLVDWSVLLSGTERQVEEARKKFFSDYQKAVTKKAIETSKQQKQESLTNGRHRIANQIAGG